MIALGQLYRKLPYPVKSKWMDLREGLSSFQCAIHYRLGHFEWWDFDGDFWEEISSGWMRCYIYPYDDLYSPKISKERQLRLGQRPRWPSSSL